MLSNEEYKWVRRSDKREEKRETTENMEEIISKVSCWRNLLGSYAHNSYNNTCNHKSNENNDDDDDDQIRNLEYKQANNMSWWWRQAYKNTTQPTTNEASTAATTTATTTTKRGEKRCEFLDDNDDDNERSLPDWLMSAETNGTIHLSLDNTRTTTTSTFCCRCCAHLCSRCVAEGRLLSDGHRDQLELRGAAVVSRLHRTSASSPSRLASQNVRLFAQRRAPA